MKLRSFFSRIYLAIFFLFLLFFMGILGFHWIEGYEFIVNPGSDTLLEANSKLFVLGKQEQIISLNEILNL